jgi:hypothetical protein
MEAKGETIWNSTLDWYGLRCVTSSRYGRFTRGERIPIPISIGPWLEHQIGYEISKFDLESTLFCVVYYNCAFFLGSLWFIPSIFTYILVSLALTLGYNSLKVFHLGWRDYFGGQGLCWFMMRLSRVNQWWFPVWWPGNKNSPTVTHACRKRRLKWVPSGITGPLCLWGI